MIHFNHDELMLMAIYATGTKSGLIQTLREMSKNLTSEEYELIALTESVLSKLEKVDDKTYKQLDLFPETSVES